MPSFSGSFTPIVVTIVISDPFQSFFRLCARCIRTIRGTYSLEGFRYAITTHVMRRTASRIGSAMSGRCMPISGLAVHGSCVQGYGRGVCPVGTKRKPGSDSRSRRWGGKPANAASRRGLQAAIAALYSDTPAPSPEEAFALRALWRQDDEARRTGQGCLPLEPTK